MKTHTITAGALACVLCLAPVGCLGDGTDDDTDDELGETSQDIIGGYATFTHPEVGLLHIADGYCTATLIAPRLLLTAAHCVNYHNKYTTTRSGTFTVQHSKTERWTYHTTRFESYSDKAGGFDKDLAVVQLEHRVPSTVASPYHVARSYPTGDDQKLAIYGYGENNPFSHTGFGVKRRRNLDWLGTLAAYDSGIDFVIAPGDSGGPVMNAAHGIIGVSSHYYIGDLGLFDWFAFVPPAYPWIINAEKNWGG